MKKDIFKIIIKAYEKGIFEEEIKRIFKEESCDTKYLSKIISATCGVDIEYKNDIDKYIIDLKEAIKNYKGQYKVVEKIGRCEATCRDKDGLTKCQLSCPFNAIINDKDSNSVIIDEELCIDCGRCIDACDKQNIIDKIEYIPIAEVLKGNNKVIAAVAPAIAGQFGNDVSIDQLRTAFKQLGFTDMVEVAFFADMLTLKEAIEFDKHVKTDKDVLITSCCCPMWIGMLKKVYNDLIKDISPSVSPMIAAGRVIKKLNPDYKVVFIGPCVAKKAEAKNKDIEEAIDYVLTFEELNNIFESCGIDLRGLEPTFSEEYASREGRLYARTGGVSIAVSEAVNEIFPNKEQQIKTFQANGIKECKKVLERVLKGDIEANFIEGMGCVGGCVGGPKAIIPKEEGKMRVDQVAENSRIKISLNSECMNSVLSKIGIDNVEDFLDESKVDIFKREF